MPELVQETVNGAVSVFTQARICRDRTFAQCQKSRPFHRPHQRSIRFRLCSRIKAQCRREDARVCVHWSVPSSAMFKVRKSHRFLDPQTPQASSSSSLWSSAPCSCARWSRRGRDCFWAVSTKDPIHRIRSSPDVLLVRSSSHFRHLHHDTWRREPYVNSLLGHGGGLSLGGYSVDESYGSDQSGSYGPISFGGGDASSASLQQSGSGVGDYHGGVSVVGAGSSQQGQSFDLTDQGRFAPHVKQLCWKSCLCWHQVVTMLGSSGGASWVPTKETTAPKVVMMVVPIPDILDSRVMMWATGVMVVVRPRVCCRRASRGPIWGDPIIWDTGLDNGQAYEASKWAVSTAEIIVGLFLSFSAFVHKSLNLYFVDFYLLCLF